MVNIWIFQSNPKFSNLFSDLNDPNCKESTWSVRQYKNKIKKDDIALLWISGNSRGIYAIVDIISDPQLMSWEEYENETTQELMVKYRYKSKFKQPFLESEIKKIPELSKLSIIRSHTGTNFPVTNPEWEKLSVEIKKRGLDVSHDANKISNSLVLLTVYSREDLKKSFQIASVAAPATTTIIAARTIRRYLLCLVTPFFFGTEVVSGVSGRGWMDSASGTFSTPPP